MNLLRALRLPRLLRASAVLLAALALASCGTESGAGSPAVKLASVSAPRPAMRIPGAVEVLNGCGVAGAADKMREYLGSRGFDVLSTGNADDQNYARTTVAVRTPGWEGTGRLAAALRTDRVVALLDKYSTVDATVFIGHDFQEILDHGNR